MKNHTIQTACLIIFVSFSSLATAQGSNDSKLSGTVTFSTDYIWHGYSKSNGNEVFQANLDYQHESGFFGGVWVSQVDWGDDSIRVRGNRLFNDVSRVEIIPYFGSTFSVSEDWHGDVHWRRYIYDDNFFGKPGDYNDFSASLNFRDLLTANIGVTDNGYDRGGIYADYELLGQYPLHDLINFSAKVGFVQSREALNFDYLYWDAGLSFYYQFIGLDFRYFNSARLNRKDETRGGFAEVKPTFVFSVSLGF
ncbi:MAG: TorF family putative porin [Nitrospinaceae bacterium]